MKIIILLKFFQIIIFFKLINKHSKKTRSHDRIPSSTHSNHKNFLKLIIYFLLFFLCLWPSSTVGRDRLIPVVFIDFLLLVTVFFSEGFFWIEFDLFFFVFIGKFFFNKWILFRLLVSELSRPKTVSSECFWAIWFSKHFLRLNPLCEQPVPLKGQESNSVVIVYKPIMLGIILLFQSARYVRLI